MNPWDIAVNPITNNGTTPALLPGVHIVYAWVSDGSHATSNNPSSSPSIGQIAAYVFVVAPLPTKIYLPLVIR